MLDCLSCIKHDIPSSSHVSGPLLKSSDPSQGISSRWSELSSSKLSNVMNKRKEPIHPTSSIKRNYLPWTSDMEETAIKVLNEQLGAGNKGDNDFKTYAYQAVADELRKSGYSSITVENVRNHARSWKNHYGTIMEIRKHTKLMWDEERKKIVVTVEDISAWNDYLKMDPKAAKYRNKCIDHWDDICVLFGKDRPVGDGVEQFDEAAEAMDEELMNEAVSSAKEGSGSGSKKQKKDRLADAVLSLARSFNGYVESRLKTTPDGTHIHEVICNVPGILHHQIMDALDVFLAKPDAFKVLGLPDDAKLDWVILQLRKSGVNA